MNVIAPEGFVTGGARLLLKAEGLSVLTLSVLVYWHFGFRWWVFIAFLLVPDLSMLGYVVNANVGSISYNVVHSYVLPLCLAALAVVSNRTALAPVVCIWMAHIGLDRFLGYGLKYRTAFGRTHLGRLGKEDQENSAVASP